MKLFMNKLVSAILSLIVLSVSSCSIDWMDESEHPMPPEVGGIPLIDFDGETSMEVAYSGGTFEFGFTANLPWTIESSSSWITIEGDTRGQGSSELIKVSFSVPKNTGMDSRQGSVKVRITDDAESTITIIQSGTPIEELGHKWYVKAEATGDGTSWSDATTLSNALMNASDNDKIHVAAGVHYPTALIAGGSKDSDKTFFVAANVSLIGGYPADATEESQPDPVVNKTVLSGAIDGGPAYHVMVIAAPKNDIFSVKISGFTITGGVTFTTAQTLKINGADIHRSYGGGIVVGNSNAEISDCVITGNESPKYCAGIYNADGSVTHLRNVVVDNNTGGNGAAIYNANAELRLSDCVIKNNVAEGVGCGLYNYGSTKKNIETVAYVYNTAFLANRTDGTKDSRRGGGFYGREGSKTVMVNCTVDGCFGGNGGGLALYGTAAAPSFLTLVSCTVTNNESSFVGGGVEAGDYTTLKLYNTIMSGNKAAIAGDNVVITSKNAPTDSRPSVIASCVDGSDIYDKDGKLIAGARFDYETMFLALKDGVRALAGENNPARQYGMSVGELKGIVTGMNPEVNPEILSVDQKGNDRSGNTMGAFVE